MKDCILVTGGTGYIGSHTAVELIRQGFEVQILDNLSNSSVDAIDSIKKITGKNVAFEKVDLCHSDVLSGFFIRNKTIRSVIHFAALKAVGESEKIPLDYYHNNLVSTMNLLKSMVQCGVKNLVFSSSCTVYGQPDRLPVTESSPVKPAMSVYGNTKKICEDIIRDASLVSGINSISLRYFNPAGAHPSGLLGDSPVKPSDNVMPAITQTAIGKRKLLEIYGNDYDTPDGTCIRDYIHVEDLARAHVDAIKRLSKKQNKSSFEVFNLGTGKGFSVMELINAFTIMTGVKLNYRNAGRRPGDVASVFADPSLAEKELGWKATHTLEEMILSAWNREKLMNTKDKETK